MDLLYNFQVTSDNNDNIGIIQTIKNITHTEIIKNTIITLNTSSLDPNYPPEKIYQKIPASTKTEYFRTYETKESNQWISIDFRGAKVNPSHLIARFTEIDLFPQFQIYGTQNGYDEEKIDTIKINLSEHPLDHLGTTPEWFLFPIHTTKAYNIIRIVGDGERIGYNNTRLVFHNLDFYGTFVSCFIKTYHCRSYKFYILITMSMFIIFH